MSQAPDNSQPCLLCDASAYDLVYDGPIRAGAPGIMTEESRQVVACSQCRLTRLAENLHGIDYYRSSEYREEYNDDATPESYLKAHVHEQQPRFDRVGRDGIAGKTVLDFGCGGGAFLDLIKGVAKKTYGIEPFSGFHESLAKRGHRVFGGGDEAVAEIGGQIDLIISFGVIEHTENPLEYLAQAYSLLGADGKMIVETDNLEDILMSMAIPEFESFFYRSAHYWYFTASTLAQLCEKAGFIVKTAGFRHTFDVSNALLWLKDGKPTGFGGTDLFSAKQDLAWQGMLEEQGLADLIYFELVKPDAA